jgi:hypothetical protein
MDTARIQTFGSVVEVPFISKRFALKRFLGLTAEEMADNEMLWKQENVDEDTALPANAELRSVGITASGIGADMSALGGATTPPPDLEGGDQSTGMPGAPLPAETPPAA